jgi:hypothetical protein
LLPFHHLICRERKKGDEVGRKVMVDSLGVIKGRGLKRISEFNSIKINSIISTQVIALDGEKGYSP